MREGLSAADATALLRKHGPNEIPEEPPHTLSKLLRQLRSPISLMLLGASFLSFLMGRDFDGNFILFLLFLNIGITFWQERKADHTVRELNTHLTATVKTLRDGSWTRVDSRMLVPGDVIELSSGDVVPADGIAGSVRNVSVNESSVTGESLPVEKRNGENMYSGTYLTTGIVVMTVTATGPATKFGRTLFSVDETRPKSMLEKDIISISRFLTVVSLISVAILSAVFLIRRAPVGELLTLDLSLLIAGIPVSLPTVMTLIIEFGVLALASKQAVVKRLSALEDLANVNFLLTDKTGTLTANQISVKDVYAYGQYTHNDVLSLAAIASSEDGENPIHSAVSAELMSLKMTAPPAGNCEFIPADSERKHSTTVMDTGDGKTVISFGAPQVIESLCLMDEATLGKYRREVGELAARGFRTLALAVKKNGDTERDMELVGLMALSDALRPESKEIVGFLKDNGLGVTMLTGDHRAIASEMVRELSLDSGRVVTKTQLDLMNWHNMDKSFFGNTGAFAEILPEDKLKLVRKAREFYTVAVNGDGINDLPALRAANVGIAVKNAVTALKESADMVLLTDGIGVIRDAILESRKIFERVYTYSVYRISESFRLIITIAILGLLYKVYPLTPLQIILIAILNDIPIISLATDRVKITNRPATIHVRQRFILSTLFGLVGVVNSILFLYLTRNVWQLPWEAVQTLFFLKLTVSGHMLIYVAHTRERWYAFLPSRQVIWATTVTQLIGSVFALTGFLMPEKLSFAQVLFVWGWAAFWMQMSELMKPLQMRLHSRLPPRQDIVSVPASAAAIAAVTADERS